MPIEPTTARQLDHRLASEQSDEPAALRGRRAGARRRAGVVRRGRARCPVGPTASPPPPDTQYRMGSITKTFVGVEVLRLRDEGRFELNDAVSSAPRRETADTDVRCGHHRPAALAHLRPPGRDLGPVVGADSRRQLGRPARQPAGPAVPSRRAVPLLQRRVCRARRARGPAPWRAVGRGRAGRACSSRSGCRAPRPDPSDAVRARLGRPPAGRPAARRARARRRGDGSGRAAVVDGGGPLPLGGLPGWRHGRPAQRRHPRRDVPAASPSTTTPARPGRGRTASAGRSGTSTASGSPATAVRCPASWPDCGSTVSTGDGCVVFANATSGMGTARPRPDGPPRRPRAAPGRPLVRRRGAGERARAGRRLVLGHHRHTTCALPRTDTWCSASRACTAGSRFRPTETGWVGLDGYHEGEPLRRRPRRRRTAPATSTWAPSGSAGRPTTRPRTSLVTSTPTAGTDRPPAASPVPLRTAAAATGVLDLRQPRESVPNRDNP